jgi:hypothetical protein
MTSSPSYSKLVSVYCNYDLLEPSPSLPAPVPEDEISTLWNGQKYNVKMGVRDRD